MINILRTNYKKGLRHSYTQFDDFYYTVSATKGEEQIVNFFAILSGGQRGHAGRGRAGTDVMAFSQSSLLRSAGFAKRILMASG